MRLELWWLGVPDSSLLLYLKLSRAVECATDHLSDIRDVTLKILRTESEVLVRGMPSESLGALLIVGVDVLLYFRLETVDLIVTAVSIRQALTGVGRCAALCIVPTVVGSWAMPRSPIAVALHLTGGWRARRLRICRRCDHMIANGVHCNVAT